MTGVTDVYDGGCAQLGQEAVLSGVLRRDGSDVTVVRHFATLGLSSSQLAMRRPLLAVHQQPTTMTAS